MQQLKSIPKLILETAMREFPEGEMKDRYTRLYNHYLDRKDKDDPLLRLFEHQLAQIEGCEVSVMRKGLDLHVLVFWDDRSFPREYLIPFVKGEGGEALLNRAVNILGKR